MANGFDRYGWWLNDWRGSASRAEMTLAERGAYRELCEIQFSLAGEGRPGVPADDRLIARYLGVELAAWLKVKPGVLRKFRLVDGCWVNAKVEDEAAYTRGVQSRASAGGKAKAAKRAAKPAAKRAAKPGAKRVLKSCPSSSSSSSSTGWLRHPDGRRSPSRAKTTTIPSF